MTKTTVTALSRRSFVLGGGAGLAMAGLPGGWTKTRAAPTREIKLRAGPATAQLAPKPHPATDVWAFNGTIPGPEIRLRQGQRVRIVAENGLDEETTVHWHGLRVPNGMDGIPHLTQKPIAPGATFTYEFDVPDAGTYWYHPHQSSSEQVGRGLYGPLIINERNPIKVDRDVTWVLDDWRLTQEAAISGDFGNRHDMSHAGRIGNTVTVNGRIPEHFRVRRGERIRLRLINAANARIFSLDFGGHDPKIIALDGQPVTPHKPDAGRVTLGPAMRVDLILDMTGKPGEIFRVSDRFYRRAYRLLDLTYAPQALRENVPDTPITLAANTMPEPDVAAITRHEIRFNGGMMGGMMMGGKRGSGAMMDMMRSGKVWFINGVAATGYVMDPLLKLELGRSYLLDMKNDTAWHHPIHLHGHSFRVMSRNGQATQHKEWQDTVLMAPRERVEIAFVADNPGDWMFHCHIFEHQEAGMMGVVRVGNGRVRT